MSKHHHCIIIKPVTKSVSGYEPFVSFDMIRIQISNSVSVCQCIHAGYSVLFISFICSLLKYFSSFSDRSIVIYDTKHCLIETNISKSNIWLILNLFYGHISTVHIMSRSKQNQRIEVIFLLQNYLNKHFRYSSWHRSQSEVLYIHWFNSFPIHLRD